MILLYLPSGRLNEDEPLTWKESFDKLLSSQSKSLRARVTQMLPLLCFEKRARRLWSPLVFRWTVPLPSVPGLRVQRGEHRLLLSL